MFDLKLSSKQLIVFIGPAGSGKSTLTASLGDWITKEQGIKVGYVNLDPGAEYTPYNPDVDVREFVTAREIMKKYKLGPNGALIKSVDLMLTHRSEIVSRIATLPVEIVLIDTPGQMELFLFRKSGPAFLEAFNKVGFTTSVIVFDPTLTYTPSDIVSLKLLTIITQLRLNTETVAVVNKIDDLKDDTITQLLDDTSLLMEKIEEVGQGVLTDLSLEIVKLLDYYKQASRLVKVSAKEGIGLESLYDILHEIYCTCGDLT